MKVLGLSGSLRAASINSAFLRASPRAHHAHDALRETLKTMAAEIAESASITRSLRGAKLDEEAMVTRPAVAGAIRGVLVTLAQA